jgi:hypothetical protein
MPGASGVVPQPPSARLAAKQEQALRKGAKPKAAPQPRHELGSEVRADERER